MHYLQPSASGNDGAHYLYRHRDLVSNATCGYEGSSSGVPKSGEFSRILRYKRETEKVRGPYNANKQSRYVELVLVVDNREYKELGESLPRVHQHCKEIANIINALYVPLNIFIALVGVVVWTEFDEIQLSTNGDTTLTNFLHYRRERLVKEHPNDNAQLLTRMQFEGSVVGKALKGPICTYEFSGGVSMDHSNVVGLVATTVAHEMGHNFGMEHDSTDCACPSQRCIMAASSSTLSPTHWSACSLEYLALAFEHGMDYCLHNKPKSLFDSPVCGNGFVEAGEQCDCGLPDRCDNPCCNATTCMLHSNASCATGACCDLQTCVPRPAGSECRSADHECDLPEYCSGHSEYCPDDVFKMDGFSCARGKAFCYHGSCRSHSDQCRLLWGPSGKSSDLQCYRMNIQGNRHGNCGYNKLNQSYIKCQDENVYCGMLHCKHLNERLEFGMESVAILSHSFINAGGSIIPCRSAIVDLGLSQADPGLVPDGARCGDGKICVGQHCMAVGALRQAAGTRCPSGCSGNGVCNSLGNCHCDVGFAPPLCDYPGTGGSKDSGPASDPNARQEVVTALYVVFLGIVPLLAIIAMIVYYSRRRVGFWGSKTTTPGPDLTSSMKGPPNRGLQISGPIPVRSDNAPDGVRTSLLAPDGGLQGELCGQFKGFTITPLPSQPPTQPPTRPQISGPVLAASTCTEVQVSAATLPAPAPAPAPAEEQSYPSLTRLAVMMRRQGSLPRKASKLSMDRESLRKLPISAPIPQPDTEGAAVVMRAQSLRGPVRPPLPTFGSMRRPNSGPPQGARPSSPPPQPPSQLEYDDCLNIAKPSLTHIFEEKENIYAVIEEESPSPSSEASKDAATSSSAESSEGLLSEIVNEIQSRNLESIYSRGGDSQETAYANMSSDGSTSGYLCPSALAAPYKPYSSILQRSAGPLAAIHKGFAFRKEEKTPHTAASTLPSTTVMSAKLNTAPPTVTSTATATKNKTSGVKTTTPSLMSSFRSTPSKSVNQNIVPSLTASFRSTADKPAAQTTSPSLTSSFTSAANKSGAQTTTMNPTSNLKSATDKPVTQTASPPQTSSVRAVSEKKLFRQRTPPLSSSLKAFAADKVEKSVSSKSDIQSTMPLVPQAPSIKPALNSKDEKSGRNPVSQAAAVPASSGKVEQPVSTSNSAFRVTTTAGLKEAAPKLSAQGTTSVAPSLRALPAISNPANQNLLASNSKEESIPAAKGGTRLVGANLRTNSSEKESKASLTQPSTQTSKPALSLSSGSRTQSADKDENSKPSSTKPTRPSGPVNSSSIDKDEKSSIVKHPIQGAKPPLGSSFRSSSTDKEEKSVIPKPPIQNTKPTGAGSRSNSFEREGKTPGSKPTRQVGNATKASLGDSTQGPKPLSSSFRAGLAHSKEDKPLGSSNSFSGKPGVPVKNVGLKDTTKLTDRSGPPVRRAPSVPTRTAPGLPARGPSPDVVSSCAQPSAKFPPDVVSSGTRASSAVSSKNPSSHVASLQQKFETASRPKPSVTVSNRPTKK